MLVDQAGCHEFPGPVHHDRPSGSIDLRPDRDDAAVLEDDRPIGNLRTGRGHDRRIADQHRRIGMTLVGRGVLLAIDARRLARRRLGRRLDRSGNRTRLANRAGRSARAPARAGEQQKPRFSHARCPPCSRYFTSSMTAGCPTNSCFTTRWGESTLTYRTSGILGPVTSTRYAWNVPAGTTTVSGCPTLNVRTFVATSLGVKTASRSVWPGASTRDDPTSGATFSSTIPGGTAVSTGTCCTLPSGWGTRLLPFTRPPP